MREMDLLLGDAHGLQDVHKAQVTPGACVQPWFNVL